MWLCNSYVLCILTVFVTVVIVDITLHISWIRSLSFPKDTWHATSPQPNDVSLSGLSAFAQLKVLHLIRQGAAFVELQTATTTEHCAFRAQAQTSKGPGQESPRALTRYSWTMGCPSMRT